MTFITVGVCASYAVIVIIVVFTGDGISNTMTYIIAHVYAGVAIIVIIVVFTGYVAVTQ